MSRNQVSTFAIREMLLWEKEMLLWDMYIYMYVVPEMHFDEQYYYFETDFPLM